MDAALATLAEDYVRVWDVTTPPDLADRVFAPDVVDHDLQPGQGPGREGVKQVIGLYQTVFPDLTLSTEDVLAADDRLVVRWSATGTHEGDQLGIPASHRRVILRGIDVLRVDHGKVVERWGQGNGLEMMQQLQ